MILLETATPLACSNAGRGAGSVKSSEPILLSSAAEGGAKKVAEV